MDSLQNDRAFSWDLMISWRKVSQCLEQLDWVVEGMAQFSSQIANTTADVLAKWTTPMFTMVYNMPSHILNIRLQDLKPADVSDAHQRYNFSGKL